MPTRFEHVYIEAAGYHLPGPPVDNDGMDAYIAPINRISGRIKARILAENGIASRHYAIDADGNTVLSHARLAANAVEDCLQRAQATAADVSLLAVGSSGGDALMPGFAAMIQGELGAPPMSTLSSQGICAAGVTALAHAAQGIELGAHRQALVVAAEMPSRMFKRSRFAPRGYDSDFDAHFLRWMLSDGAGALLLTDTPSGRNGVRLKLSWVHQQSFAGDYPVCMQLGLSEDRNTSFLDYPSSSEAEAAGALSLRQDIRLLPHLFDVSIHEYVKLVEGGWIKSDEIDHFLCHYSSAKFIPVVADLLDKAGLSIPQARWYSNLATRGNTGAASIFIMLAEFLDTHTVKPGEKIFCFIPESGRISAAYMLLEVEAANAPQQPALLRAAPSTAALQPATISAPHDPASAPDALQPLLTTLAGIWHDYRSSVWRSPVIHKLVAGRFTQADYQCWTAQWVPQVREGSKWMREAVASLTGPYAALGDLIELHATDEQNDFMILYQDYQAAGGSQPIDALRRNPGGEALNAYLHALAATENPLGLLGAIYIIEGTGQRIVPALLPLLRKQVDLPASAFRFLEYHGANDEHHLARWLAAVEITLALEPAAGDAILATARRTAQLYLMQFEHIIDG
ncbi:3-oxoacyl-[acyl-carrier-protein] synthase-3 [Andreprevotia lacus DSM 23236]|jgi:3-oxoacyl-[acyl-carrier-protein] synthase-3|uniref:3-oxoacyl-[acyl-carrier-protein] synthase-3 n=1 Tax=Andreprevotia lacus DSM 23236 TaxID=1121001 RepID=A0A1W1XSY7_9NEIS|nr:StlD/DarB family beta-ketosynthase [Andreprevotia lacus]SMC27090.1 3-oxoacyl-[acyl-carrier-protein] synthase-3 [Andreprevotia lacus DSM 23236]